MPFPRVLPQIESLLKATGICARVSAALLRIALALLVPGFAAGPLVAHGQVQLTSSSIANCVGCSLAIDSVLKLGGRDEPGGLFMGLVTNGKVVRMADGRFIVSEVVPIQVFNSAGRPLEPLGRQGQGPGEFPYAPNHVVRGPDADIYMYVQPARRVLRFDSALRYIKSITLQQSALRPVVLSNGYFAALNTIPATLAHGQTARQPLFTIFSDGGEVVRSVGTESTVADAIIAAGPDGTVWTAKSAPYELRQWSQTGDLLRVINRTTPFIDRRELAARVSGGPVQPQLTDIRVDEAGRLWVAIVQPAEAARVPDSRYESVIEVLDPSTGRLLASARVPVWINRLLDDNYMVNIIHGLDLGPELRFFRARLTVP